MSHPARRVHAESRRACGSCAAAKAKCVPIDGLSCERCERMGRVCGAQPRQERRRPGRRSHAALVQKVDELVALLASRQRAGAGDANLAGSTPSAVSPTADAPSTSQPPMLDDAEAETLLQNFRQNQAAATPFLHLPAHVTAAALRCSNPVLFYAIMMSASYATRDRQEALARAALREVADQLLMHGRKSLGLLQGMLMLANCYISQIFANPQVNNLLHLCMALVMDLGLSHAPARIDRTTILDGAKKVVHGETVFSDRRTLDDRRAYAGCYYLASVMSTCVTVSAGLPWSPQLDDACAALDRSARDADRVLATMVRLQSVVSQIDRLQKELDAAGGPAAPLEVYVAPFEERLTRIWDECPAVVRQSFHVSLDYHVALTHLFRLSLSDRRTSPPAAAAAARAARARCLREAAASFELYLTLPPERFYHQTVAVFVQSGHVLVTLSSLARMREPWPADVPPVAALMGRGVEFMERAAACSGEGGARLWLWAGWFSGCVRRVVGAPEEGGEDGGPVAGGAGGSGVEPGGRHAASGASGEAAVCEAEEGGMGEAEWTTMMGMGDVSWLGMFEFPDDSPAPNLYLGSGDG